MQKLATLNHTPTQLPGHDTLVLNNPERVWVVHEGSIDVLSTRVEHEAPLGMRRYLFSVAQSRALFGSISDAATGSLGLIGVANGRTQVLELGLGKVAQDLKTDRLMRSYLTMWANDIGQQIAGDAVEPSTTVRISEAGEHLVSAQEVVAADFDSAVLFRLNSGAVTLLGEEDMELTSTDGYVLVSPQLWLRITSETAEVQVVPLHDVTQERALAEGLANLHRMLHWRLVQVGKKEEAAEIERLRTREHLTGLQTAAAMHDLSAVLDPVERFQWRDDELLTALGIVGQVMGIKIQPPAASEDMSKVNDPIEAIARASRVQSRKIILGPDWWKRDNGPLVGFLKAEKPKPVALLPKGGVYEIVDPHVRYRQPLRSEQRETLEGHAYMLYCPLPSKLSGVLDLVRFTTRGRTRDTILIMFCGLCATLLGMIAPKVIGVIVDGALPNADTQLLYELGAVLLIAAMGGAFFTYVQVMNTVRVGTMSELVSQSAIWGRLLKFRPDFFRKFSSGDLQMRVNAVGEVSRDLNGATMRPLISGLLALLNFFILWYYSWTLAKIAIWVGVVVILLTLIISHFIRNMSFQLHTLDGAFHGLMVQMIGAVGKLRVAGGEHRAFNYWVSRYTPRMQLVRRIQLLQDLMTTFNLVMPTAALGWLFWKSAKLTVDLAPTDPDYISLGDFIAFNTAFTLYLAGWTDVSGTLVGVLDSLVKGRRIRPLLEAEPEVPDDATDPGRLQGFIRFDQVSFRYVKNGPLILDNVSFDISPGEFVAFVGPSGSGKSTILRMLLGFESPEYGRVLYDGQDLAGLDVLAVRRQIGTVIQNGRLNAGNIIDNIANNAKLTHAEIWDAIASAGMSEEVEKMPMGLHTVVAEGGVNFSGGQRQRLLIARALATRPKIVYFDEATSALDNKTQAIVSEAMQRRKVTRVVIAHRLSTIRNADRIFVIDQGKVVQQGRFDELVQQPGQFQDLVSRQMV